MEKQDVLIEVGKSAIELHKAEKKITRELSCFFASMMILVIIKEKLFPYTSILSVPTALILSAVFLIVFFRYNRFCSLQRKHEKLLKNIELKNIE